MLATRSHLVLLCSEGLSNQEVASRLRVCGATVCKWRGRFVRARYDGLLDEPRSGASRSIMEAEMERVVTMTIETLPMNTMYWSARPTAAVNGRCQAAVTRIGRDFGLQHHRVDSFKLEGPAVRGETPGQRGAVLLPTGARDGPLRGREVPDPDAGPHPAHPANAAGAGRQDGTRHRTTTGFAALEVASGSVSGLCRCKKWAVEVRKFLDSINPEVPEGLDIHIVLDQCGTHKTRDIRD